MPTCGQQIHTFAMSMLPFSMAAFTRSFSACGSINRNGFDVRTTQSLWRHCGALHGA